MNKIRWGEEMNTEKWFKDKLEAFREDAEFYAEELILDLTEQIVAAMKELGVNRTELAARMGVSKAFVTKLLRGNTNVTLKTMASLARSLGCNVNIEVCPKKESYTIQQIIGNATRLLVMKIK